jgi:D-glycero-D-manno-heptose 1,7-bisphosphate phosphatase
MSKINARFLNRFVNPGNFNLLGIALEIREYAALSIIILMYPAIFLDRDGVIIENRPSYVRSWSDVEIYPRALSALARLKDSPYKIVLVTNQSAIGRGFLSVEDAEAINQRLLGIIEAASGRIDGIFMCPHAPQDKCECRKPRPGLLLQAAEQLSLDLSNSILIGDALSDLKAGMAAGIQKVALVRTGRGAQQLLSSEAATLQPFLIYNTLAEALDDLVK